MTFIVRSNVSITLPKIANPRPHLWPAIWNKETFPNLDYILTRKPIRVYCCLRGRQILEGRITVSVKFNVQIKFQYLTTAQIMNLNCTD